MFFTGFDVRAGLSIYSLISKIYFSGEVSEWPKEHAWKVCILQKGIVGSNPTLSAFIRQSITYGGVCIFYTEGNLDFE